MNYHDRVKLAYESIVECRDYRRQSEENQPKQEPAKPAAWRGRMLGEEEWTLYEMDPTGTQGVDVVEPLTPPTDSGFYGRAAAKQALKIKELEKQLESLVPADPAPVPLTVDEYTALAHRIASKYAHRSDPRHIAYTFLPHTLEQFVRKIEQLVRRKTLASHEAVMRMALEVLEDCRDGCEESHNTVSAIKALEEQLK